MLCLVFCPRVRPWCARLVCLFVSLCRQVLADKHWKHIKKDCSERREHFFSKVVISDVEQSVPAPPPTVEDARSKRRRLYKLASERKPPFPVMHRNFYLHVIENKEIIKALSLLSTCVQPLKPVKRFRIPLSGRTGRDFYSVVRRCCPSF